MDRASDASAPPGALEDFFRMLFQGEPSVEYQHELRAPYTEMVRQKLMQSLMQKRPLSLMEKILGRERTKKAEDVSNF